MSAGKWIGRASSQGDEVDLIVEGPDGQVLGIEVDERGKNGATLTTERTGRVFELPVRVRATAAVEEDDALRQSYFSEVLHSTVPDLVKAAVCRDDDYWQALHGELTRLLHDQRIFGVLRIVHVRRCIADQEQAAILHGLHHEAAQAGDALFQ